MENNTEKTDQELAEAHWKFIEKWLHMVYVDAMIHGIKHGRELENKKSEALRDIEEDLER